MNLRALIEKLDPTTKQALEEAIALCLNQQHYDVEIEHVCLSLLKSFNQDTHTIEQEIYRALSHVKTGNTQTPALSPRVIDWVSKAWNLASLEWQANEISLRALLTTLKNDSTLKQLAEHMAPSLLALNIDAIETAETVTSAQNKPSDALKQFTINVNEQARQGKIDEVIGRETEINQMMDILARRRQNNPILTGDPGVGKTAIVEGLALKIEQGDAPDSLKGTEILTLDLGLLQAGASVKGEFEKRLKGVIEAVQQSATSIILFIDEAHTLIGGEKNDAANLLKPALARGELRTIAATTWQEYKKYFEKDAALTRRFQVVNVDEPNMDVATDMLRALAPKLEAHHHVTITDDAVIQAVSLSARYITERKLPDKAVSVLDTACARRIKASPEIATLANLKRALERLKAEVARGFLHKDKIKILKAKIKKSETALKCFDTQAQVERNLIAEIKVLEKQLTESNQKVPLRRKLKILRDKLAKAEQPIHHLEVDANAVSEVVANWTGIPLGRMRGNELTKLTQLESTLSKRIIGQKQAIKLTSEAIKASRAKLADPRKPIGVFLFVGTSGIGKTETALALAEELYGSDQALTTINMSEFKEAHKVSLLAGSPPGYVGYGEGGILTESVRRKPYNLVLLDEMEKAHPSIQDVFYRVFDKGVMSDGEGREVNFKNSVIIMTSNAGSELLDDLSKRKGTPPSFEELQALLTEELQKTFKPAFLGRVTIIPYFPLKEDELKKIATLQINKIRKRVESAYGIKVEVDRSVVTHLANSCQHNALGARQIEAQLNQKLLPKLADLLLTQLKKTVSTININISAEMFVVSAN